MRNTSRFTKKSFLRLMALMLAVLTVFSGCGKSETAGEGETEIAVPVSTPEPQPITGGEVKMYIPTNADITDPLKVNTEEMLNFFSMIYESLVSISADGKLTAELAENWFTEDGGKTWNIKIREWVTWHGHDISLTSRDIILTFERLKTIGEDSYYAYCVNTIDTIEAVDNQNIKVTMKNGGYASLYALTFPVMLSGEATAKPVGTGPYVYDGYRDSGILLRANEAWWKQRPYIDSFLFIERDSNDVALASYSAGQLDMVPTSSTTVGKYRQEGITIVQDVMTQSVEIMLVNSTSSALSDVRVRQAIAYGLDRSKIISNIYMNRAQSCDVPVAPDSWIYDSASKLYDYNASKALALLSDAGWTDVDDDGRLEKGGMALTELNLMLLANDSTDSARKNAAAAIAEQLGELGINVEVVTAAYTVGQTEGEYMEMLKNGEYDIALIGLNLGRDSNLTEVMSSNGSANYGNYYDYELDVLAGSMMSAGDEAAYRDAASAFQLAFAEKLPFIPLYFRLNSIVYSADIKGMTDVREPDIMRSVDKWYMFTDGDNINTTGH